MNTPEACIIVRDYYDKQKLSPPFIYNSLDNLVPVWTKLINEKGFKPDGILLGPFLGTNDASWPALSTFGHEWEEYHQVEDQLTIQDAAVISTALAIRGLTK